MRELKFRAWNSEHGQFAFSNGFIEEKREFGIQFEVGFSDYPSPDEWIIEQYTGLKDKNGKEIYEGDNVMLAGDVGTVVWCSEDAAFNIVGKEMSTNCFSPPYMEVLGNIHENPDQVKE